MGESMTARSRLLRFLVSVPCVLVFLAATMSSAEDTDRSRQRPLRPVVLAVAAAQSVGPGPLPPPHRERAVRHSSMKIDDLEDAIDHCVDEYGRVRGNFIAFHAFMYVFDHHNGGVHHGAYGYSDTAE